MTDLPPANTLDRLTMEGGFTLEELVNRATLVELCAGVAELFSVPLRLFNGSGALVVDTHPSPRLHQYFGTQSGGRRILRDIVESVKALNPTSGMAISAVCPSSSRFLVAPVIYDTRRLARCVLGPFVPSELEQVPPALFQIDPGLEAGRLTELWRELPRMTDANANACVRHLTKTLELVLFSGHRALLASNMHLASTQESYRELEEKNANLSLAYERLKELDRLKSNFLATVSHELRTPLTSIIGYSEMLSAGIAGELTTEQLDFVNTIHEKGEQLLELIKGLLDLTKLESGTLNVRMSEVDMTALLEDVVATLTPTARRKEVELTASSEPGLLPVWGDAPRLRQVFVNLTENAVKFTPAGGSVRLTAAVVMELLEDDEDGPAVVLKGLKRPMVEVRVADTGIGIPPEERNKVFDAFYQVDSSSTREAGGTGLGLSIVRRLVDSHSGLVWIEGNQPNGTVFCVKLPCKKGSFSG